MEAGVVKPRRQLSRDNPLDKSKKQALQEKYVKQNG